MAGASGPADLRRRAAAGAVLLSASILWGGAAAQDAPAPSGGALPASLPQDDIGSGRPSVQRFALVVGNADYEQAPDLPNAASDARAVADLLRRNGYYVVESVDLTKRGFEAALRSLLTELESGGEFVLFYSGHGVQIGGGNYLLPVDADIGSIYDVPFEAISLSSLLALSSARARSVVAILDSCRNNPFADQTAVVQLDGTPQALRSGFTPQDSPVNSLIVFSTSPGAIAFDGPTGGNSPFTSALVEVLSDADGQPVDLLLRDIRRRVYEATDRRQLPWDSSSLVEPVSLTGTPLTLSMAPAAEGGGEPEVMEVESELDRQVPLYPALSAEAAGLRQEPGRGRIEVFDGRRFLTLPAGASLGDAEAANLFYTPSMGDIPAREVGAGRGLEDQFILSTPTGLRQVALSLDVNPCDYEAGDYLDPEGVGVARYANEIDPAAARAACEAAVRAMPEVGRFHYQLGRALLAASDLAGAEAAFRRAQELGHTRAWQALGALAAERVTAGGGAEDTAAPPEALALYAEGVRRGDPFAFHSLGLQLLLFPRAEGDRQQGFELLSRAIELGHTFSMNALGLYFLAEGSDHYSPERGLRYLRESADRGDIYGYANMGFVALTGAGGVEVDLEAAEAWFRRAAEEGHPTAPSSLGRMYNAGQIGGRPDPGEAIRWYDIGLSRGDGWGGANAAWIIANAPVAGFEPWDAAVRAAKAAALRDRGAAAAAEEVLASLPQSAIEGGVQSLLAELGYEVSVDGSFGPASEAALARLEADTGAALPQDPLDRLRALARIYWNRTGLRLDLY